MRKKVLIAKVVSARRLQKEAIYQYSEQGQLGSTVDHFPSQYYSENAYPNTDIQYQATLSYTDGSQYVLDWLKSLNLENYSNILLSGGYCDFSALIQLNESGLDTLGITNPDHRSLLLSGVTHLIEAYNQQEYSSNNSTYDPYLYVNPEYIDPNNYQSSDQNDVNTSNNTNNNSSSSSKPVSLVPYGDEDE